MPRNGSGVYSLPPGSTFVPGTLAQSSVVNGINNDLATDLNTPRPIVAGGTGATTKIWEDLVVYAAKAGNYTAVSTDNNAVHRYTATATVTLTAAATLLSGWHYTIIADGATVTVDPNGAETINGQTTMIVPNGSTAEIICDGAAFFTILRPSAWQIVERRVFSAVTVVDFTNLYGDVKVTGFIDLSGASSDMFWRSSTNNGSSYDQAGADYTAQITFSSAASVTTSRLTASYALIAGGGFGAGSIQLTIVNFGRASVAAGFADSTTAPTTGIPNAYASSSGQFRASSVARNALRIGTVTGTAMTGYLTLEVMA